MTIKEAEEQYDWEVENHIEKYKDRLKLTIYIFMIIGFILIILGIALRGIADTLPPEVWWEGTESEYETESDKAFFYNFFGTMALIMGAIFLVVIVPSLYWTRNKGPKNFLPQIKRLYFNYLKCEDMSRDYKEFYKQKLEDIRNMELVNAIHNASATASTAIMFSALRK